MSEDASPAPRGIQSPKTTPLHDRQRQLKEKDLECAALEKQVVELERRLGEATDTRRKVETRARTVHATDRSDLQTEHAVVLKKFREYKRSLTQLRKELQRRDGDLRTKTAELDGADLQFQDLQSRISKIRAAIKRVQSDEVESVARFSELQKRAEQAKSQAQSLLSRTAEAEQLARNESSLESSLRNEVRMTKLEKTQLEEEIERLNRKSEVDEFMKGEFVSFMRVTKVAFHERSEQKADLDAAIAENRRLRRQLEDENDRMRAFEEKQELLQGQLDRFDSLRDELTEHKRNSEVVESRVRKILEVCLADPRVELREEEY